MKITCLCLNVHHEASTQPNGDAGALLEREVCTTASIDTLEASSVPDRSQRLRDIDLSRVFINGRVIKATVIIAIGDEPDIDWLENINFPVNPVVKQCFVASSIDNICRRRFGETPPEVIGKIPYKEPGPSCKPGPWLIWGYFPNWGAYYFDCIAV